MASWAVPRTWTAGEVPTAAMFNADVRDNLLVVTHMEDVEPTSVDVTNTTAETSIFSYTVPANRMSTNRMLRLTLLGDLLYNNSDTNQVTLRTKLGGTTINTYNCDPSGLSIARRWWELVIYVANRNATNSQIVISSMHGGAVPSLNEVQGSGAAINTAVDALLEVTAQWSAASTNNSFRREYGVLEMTGS